MHPKYQIVLAIAAGAALGAAAVQGLHAQAKPKAYIITESELLDAAALAAYVPKAQAAVRAAGGTPGIIATGKIIAVVGEAPKRIGASEWPSAEQAQAYLGSAERKALDSERAKAFKTTRQFIVERPAN
jgi:uncharacterized protein (DUF1330 family)